MESASGKSGVQDGTDEKLVTQEDQQNEVSKDQSEVKYTSEVQNGETKMDCEMRRAFVGMGKDELMKFANDPFWVLTRQFLFALFWVMWVAMLVGSIVIVIFSPKCSGTERPWFKHSLVYKFDIKAFEHGSLHSRIGDLKALKDHLHYFEYLGVDTIRVNSLMEGTDRDRDTIKDFKKMDSSYGSFEILKDLTNKMKKKGIRLVMSFDPNHSSDKHEWFRNSIAEIEPYSNYYVWARGSFSSDGDLPLPPNNWHSVTGGSAWSYVKERGKFYLHQFSSHQPDLNFREQHVVDYFKGVFLFWLDFGLSGIHLDNAKYLMEDMQLTNETINPVPGATHEDYGFYSHTHTTFDPQTFNVLKEWAHSVENHGSVLSVSDFNPDTLDSAVIIYHTMKLNSKINATEFAESIKNNLARNNPTWQWECQSDCPDEETSKALISMFVLLPGISVIRGGEELTWPPSSSAPWNSQVINGSMSHQFDYLLDTIEKEKSDETSHLNLLRKLISLRKNDAFKFGSTEHHVLNTTVFAFTRTFSQQGYLIAFNFASTERTVSFNTFDEINNESELSLVHLSKKPQEAPMEEKSTPFVTIPGRTLVVYSFSATSVVSS